MPNVRPHDPLAVRAYARCVRLYPRRHRGQFGDGMLQVFRDQHRSSPGRSARAALLLRTLLDFACTLPRAHWEERQPLAAMLTIARPRTAALLTGALVTLVVYGGVLALTWACPRTYLSTARIRIPHLGVPIPLLGQPTPGMADPFLAQTEFARITSPAILDRVIRDLDLGRHFAATYHSSTPVTPEMMALLLRDRVQVRRFRNTDMFEVRAYFPDAKLAAAIANRIVEEYRDGAAGAGGIGDPRYIMITDVADPGLRPVSPNVPLNVVVGFLAALALGTLTAILVALLAAFRRRRRMA